MNPQETRNADDKEEWPLLHRAGGTCVGGLRYALSTVVVHSSPSDGAGDNFAYRSRMLS